MQNIGSADAASSSVAVDYIGRFTPEHHESQHGTGELRPGEVAVVVLPHPFDTPDEIRIHVDCHEEVWEYDEDNNWQTDYP